MHACVRFCVRVQNKSSSGSSDVLVCEMCGGSYARRSANLALDGCPCLKAKFSAAAASRARQLAGVPAAKVAREGERKKKKKDGEIL